MEHLDIFLPLYVPQKHYNMIKELAAENGKSPAEFVLGIVTSELDEWRDHLHYLNVQNKQDDEYQKLYEDEQPQEVA